MNNRLKKSIRSPFFNSAEYDMAYNRAMSELQYAQQAKRTKNWRKRNTKKVRIYYLRRKRLLQRDKTIVRAANLRNMFGLTIDQYNTQLKKQNGVCAICLKKETERFKGKVKNLSVDHCHKTNKLRGLLCFYCNTGLGRFRDNPKLLQKAANYVYNNGVFS